MALTITKISGVLLITKTGNTNPKSYFNATGKYQASDDSTTILITITDQAGQVPDQYTVAFGDLTVGTSTPTTMSSALVLLNSIFGT